MHQILQSAPPAAWVLDLGSQYGSFPPQATAGRVVRLDLDARAAPGVFAVQADAAHLPFRDHTFARAVANHSLEHFDALTQCLSELGRVLAPNAQLYVAVPDASTLADQLYRWLARGGGHVNPFVEAGARSRIASPPPPHFLTPPPGCSIADSPSPIDATPALVHPAVSGSWAEASNPPSASPPGSSVISIA